MMVGQEEYCFLKYVRFLSLSLSRACVCVCVFLCVGSQHKREPTNQLIHGHSPVPITAACADLSLCRWDKHANAHTQEDNPHLWSHMSAAILSLEQVNQSNVCFSWLKCSLEPFLFGPDFVSSGQLNLKVLHNTHLYSWLNIDSGRVPHLRVHGDIPTGLWIYNVRKSYFACGPCAPDIWCSYMQLGFHWSRPVDWRQKGRNIEIFPARNIGIPLIWKRTICVVNIFSFVIRPWCTIPASEPLLKPKEMLFSLADFKVSKCGSRGPFTDTSRLNTKARRCCCSRSFHTVA